MGQEATKFLDLQQSIRRGPQNVVSNEISFQFCKTWDPSDVHDMLAMYTRIAKNDEDLSSLGHQLRQEALQDEIRRLKSLLSAIDDEEERFHATHPEGDQLSLEKVSPGDENTASDDTVSRGDDKLSRPKETTKSTSNITPLAQSEKEKKNACMQAAEEGYLTRRQEVSLDLERKERELQILQNTPSMEDVDFSLPVVWNLYFESIHKIDIESHSSAQTRARKQWHPATQGYSMERDPTADKLLKDYYEISRAPTPAEANQINEGHTDDNASISDDEKLDSDTEVVDKDILPEGRSEDKPPRTETLPLKDVIDTNTGLEKRTHTAVPPSYDPSIRSPVFFGYSTTLITKIETVNKETDLNQEEREEKYFEKLQAQSFHKLQEAMTSENGKMRALEERRNAQMEKRQREEKIRTNELEEARKEGLDPSDDFFRKAEDARLKSVAQEAKEDETYQTQKDSIMSRMSKAKEISEKEIKQVKDMRSPKNPVGALRRSFHVDKLKELHRSLDEAKADLDQALKTYDQTKNRSRVQVGQKESNVQQRAQLLFVEDQVKAAEKRVAFIIGQVEEDEFMLKRAEALIQLESTYYPSFDALAKCPNLLTQALALVIMCSGTPKQKLKFIFNAFIQNDSSQDISTGLSRSAFLHLIQSSFRALDQLGQLHLPSRLTTDVPCTDESYLRDIVLQVMGKSPFLTWYNFKRFTLDAIQRSKYLSTILRLRWKYEHISRFQQQNMTPLRQYECGIISASDLKYSMARVSVFSRSDLSLNKKELMHTRALAMGSNDPLKADYSRYLKLRRTKVLSNVVPLDHGCYKNLIVYRKEVAEKAAIRLQTMWRAKKGRQDATMAARKQAFYHAKGTALKEARLKVEQEWHALEAISQTTLDKMKFDAKIRMRQVKLRTKGLAFTRDEVLKVMIEEAVQDAFEEIDHRFREMEESAGYCPRMLRFDPLDTSHFSEIAKSLVAQVHAARFPSPGTAALLRSIAEKELKEKKEVPETVSVGVEPPETNVVPFVLNDMNKEKKKQSQIQNASMIKGLSRANAVLSPQEKRLWFQLICSNPPKNDWSNRLFFVCDGMTELKLAELLLELPSKRHAVEYVNVFRNAVGVYDRDALITDLMEHFRIHRGVESLADALIAIARSDIETLWSGDVKQLLSNEEIFLEKNVQEYYKSISGRLIRELKRRGQDVDFKQKIDVEARQKVSTETKKRALEAIATWKMAEHSLAFTRRQIGARKGEIAVQSYDRTLWSERLKRALMADVGENTYTEVINVCQDFLEVAKHVATQIIREFHLPDHEKSLMPLPIKFDMDGRNNDNIRNCVGRGLRFELHNIRFRVAVDDHGRFDGSDELAAKAASAECRNSSLFLPLMLLTPNVLVPLQCCIDYHGMRVVCSSKLPIERYDMSDTDSLQSQEKELVYGSENKGRTVVFHSKTLDSALARVNENLNLAAHCVRGSQDLTAKLINGAGDMQGYIGRDETFCLLKFRRMMPPEDPEETRHIEASTRGMSILWRQLRPALIKTNSAALSCDALSLFTHHTPDWEVQTDRVKNCTKRLLIEVIPCFARKMATREKYFTSPTFSLVRELHRHGINIRHLGLIRSLFYFQLDGTAALTYNSRIIGTTRDMTRELSRGDIVHIQGEDYTVSESLTDIFSDRAFTVDRCFMGDSCQNIQIHKGTIRSQFSIRETLLVEMIKRTVKNLVRSSLRALLHSRQLAVGPSQRSLLVRMLNYVSGSVPGSDEFWQTQVFNGIRSRYGECAASYVDRLNLRRAPVEIIRYLASTTGFDLSRNCWHRFTLHPVSFLFTIDDMEADVVCRVRHNLMVLHFSAASLLLGHASSIQGTTYQAGILEDSPCGYWPLNERRGSTVARNLGSSCDHGKFSPQCILEVLGPIANDDLRRAVGFPKATHGYITCSKAKKWDTAVSLEAWVCVDPSGRGIRAIVCHGRFTLAVLKNNLWGAWVNMNDIDVVVSGSPAIPDTWTHLVSTFDGTALQLYVNGGLYGDIDVQSEVNSQLERRKAKFQSKRKEIDDQEIKAKADCMKEVERECRSLYMTKEGKQIIKDISKKIVEDFEFKLRLKKRASQQAGLDEAQIKDGNQTKLSKSEIETLAKQQHMVQVYNQRILSITALYQNQRNDLNSKIEQELADEKSQDGRPFRIGCVGNTSSNTKFFVGAICHVAFYSRCINRDIVTRHYIRGTLDRAWTSDALFELSAAQFTQALEFAPNDRAMLSSFAVNICSALKYDLDHVRSQEMYKSKVSRAVEAFRTTENYEGCAEILRNLPKDVRFSDLFRETYACLNELNPRYWSRTSNVSLLELDKLPAQFFMSGETKSSSMVNLLREEIRTYADIIRRVIAEYPTNYGDGLTDLKWLLDLETDSAVVYFVLWLQAGEDSRRLDFTSVRDITEGDMDVITSSNRSCLAMRLDGCTNLSDKSVCMIALRCTGIELLDLSDIHHLTDESLKAISKTCSNLKAIYLTRCSLITDMGIEYLEKCQDVREIIVNYCGKLTDDSLMSIATHMRLTRVEAAFCLQFSGFNSFCQATISSALTTLDLSGCRRLSDEALMSIGTKFTRLTYLNLAYCDKITHRGIWAITHNCLELTYLNMEDMHLATDIVFTFDKGGDGRESVAKVVLSKLSKIVLANCTKLTDTGIGYLLHRARTMTSIDISGCNLTDQGVKHLTTSIFNGSVIGEQIRELDLSYCMSLTSESLCYIRDRCKQLVSLYLTGCVLLQDVEMVGLIKSCSKISVLGLGFCRELTDNVLITIADCLWLEALYINRCSKFTDVGVCALASQCTGLQSLNLSGCKRLTDSSIQSLNESCMKLIQLDVTFCPHVSKSVLSKFKTNRVRMDLRCDIDTNGNQDIDLPTAKTQEKLFRQQSEKFLVSQNESPDK